MKDKMKDELGIALDVLNASLRRVEAAIVDLGYGVRGSVPIPQLKLGEELCFGKEGGKWGLFIEYPDGQFNCELTAAPQRERVLAARAVPRLVKHLRDLSAARAVGLEDLALRVTQFAAGLASNQHRLDKYLADYIEALEPHPIPVGPEAASTTTQEGEGS